MTGEENPLEMARRHVHEGEKRIEKQRELVATLKAYGDSEAATEARNTLKLFEETQVLHRQHLARLEREQGKGGSGLADGR